MDPLNLVPYLPRAEWSLGPGDQGWLAMLGQVLKEYQTCTRRRSLLRARVMDFVTSTAILPLLLGCVGVCSLLKLLQWLRTRACVRNAVVVVTGATSGLGRECARVFHAAGAKLVLCGRNAKALEELTRELAASRATKVQTHKPYTVTFDLTDPGAIVGAAAEILQCFGYVDVLINNAGISYRGTIVDTSLDVDRRVMETNYFGPVALTKALLSSMIRRRQGHVVAISSIQGKISVPFRSAYAASKHATQAFFDCLRAEVEQHDIEVTVVSPGYIQTSLSLNAVTADGSKYGVMDETTAQGRSPSQVARDVLAAVGKKKKDVVLADVVPSLAVYLRTLAPRLFFSLMASRARKEQKPKRC
ncbi:dehydrogenase/reductase SDR family member 7B isoform X1 [Balaenoptera acutorostrata]|uniref:Dehydrogenase/reductase SDR family member 7B n=2 Tax=Balaenoptera acutorostrata TaxID=9767 RepID=A0ABM3SP36_BALAC|nr:dehydrogenase/reductase SDR family member 7B isoform X1 [Balaenoptera acutorostrata]XP_057391604.1 dehydrogenase/reductase SDR family member 7B isoform X1 [Balaenoptera acutorostrata]XP_057391605.1 dehydrogenase/reductase SDR family member 7B isoform X1 [Balaenoptera acutorostrata]